MSLPRNVPCRKEFLGFGEDAVVNTVSKMKKIINDSMTPYVRGWAEKILTFYNVAANDKLGEVMAIYNFLRTHLRYTRDPLGLEYVQTPPVLLEMLDRGETPMADCDDYTVLGLSLLKSIGYPTAIKIAGYKPDKKFTHVYGLVNIKNKWLPFDAIKADRMFGYEHPGATVAREFEMT